MLHAPLSWESKAESLIPCVNEEKKIYTVLPCSQLNPLFLKVTSGSDWEAHASHDHFQIQRATKGHLYPYPCKYFIYQIKVDLRSPRKEPTLAAVWPQGSPTKCSYILWGTSLIGSFYTKKSRPVYIRLIIPFGQGCIKSTHMWPTLVYPCGFMVHCNNPTLDFLIFLMTEMIPVWIG